MTLPAHTLWNCAWQSKLSWYSDSAAPCTFSGQRGGARGCGACDAFVRPDHMGDNVRADRSDRAIKRTTPAIILAPIDVAAVMVKRRW